MTDASETTLWEELRQIVRHAVQIWGEPASLLEDLVLPRAEVLRLRSWIAALEAVARALLVALAARLPRPAAATPRPPRPTRPPSVKDSDADESTSDEAAAETPPSERWAGVKFRFTPQTSAGGGPSSLAGPRRFLSVRGLAFRLEALIRVARAPEPFARRLARRLAAEPALAARALSRPERRSGHPPPYEELVSDALALARSVAAPVTG